MRRERAAYTLLELVLVLALLVIVSAISFPSVVNMWSLHRAYASSDTIRAAWVQARAHAIEEGRPYRFSTVDNNGNFRVAPDAPEYWSGSAPPVDDDHPAFILEDSVAVRLNSGGAGEDKDPTKSLGSVNPSDWKTFVIFDSDGTAHGPDGNPNPSMPIDQHKDKAALILTIRGLTGGSSVREGR